jgi:hypothetical protein
MAITNKFGTGFPIIGAQARIVEQVYDRQATANLRVTRIIGIKNQPIGGTDENGNPRTKSMGFRIEFKNLSDEQVAQLTIGSLIAFDGELMEEKFKAGDDWVSNTVIESWNFYKVARSAAERQDRGSCRVSDRPTRMQAEADEMNRIHQGMATAAAPAPSYESIPF